MLAQVAWVLYHQLWSQLKIIKGVLYRHYTPDPILDSVLVKVLTTSLHHEALYRNHDVPSADHQGTEKPCIKSAKKHNGQHGQ